MSKPTALRTMAEFKAIGLVDKRYQTTTTDSMEIVLRQQFEWFLSEEFHKLKEDFTPTDYSEYMEEKEEDKEIGTRESIILLLHLQTRNQYFGRSIIQLRQNNNNKETL
jgi:hypothetical protein